MKTLLIICSTFFFSLTLNAQSYAIKYRMNAARVPPIEKEKMRRTNPLLFEAIEKTEEAKSKYFLEFDLFVDSKQTFFYCTTPDKPNLNIKTDRGTIIYFIDAKNDQYYRNTATDKFIASLVKNDQHYCITDELPTIKWTVGSENKLLMGFNCQKATATYRGKPIEAWFTNAIPLPYGPVEFHGLPGLILYLKFDGEEYAVVEICENVTTPNFSRTIECDQQKSPISLDTYYAFRRKG